MRNFRHLHILEKGFLSGWSVAKSLKNFLFLKMQAWALALSVPAEEASVARPCLAFKMSPL